MAKKLRFNQLVVDDLQDAVDWYDQRSPTAAVRFRKAIREGLRYVATTPGSCPFAFEDVRQLRIERFPYVILFRIKANTVVIEGVHHTSTDPDKWIRRAGGRAK